MISKLVSILMSIEHEWGSIKAANFDISCPPYLHVAWNLGLLREHACTLISVHDEVGNDELKMMSRSLMHSVKKACKHAKEAKKVTLVICCKLSK